MYTATNKKTGVTEVWTEQQVRVAIIKAYQHDMGTVLGDGFTDEEIVEGVINGDINDYFDGNVYDDNDYDIIKTD
jgi:hypothetical protein